MHCQTSNTAHTNHRRQNSLPHLYFNVLAGLYIGTIKILWSCSNVCFRGAALKRRNWPTGNPCTQNICTWTSKTQTDGKAENVQREKQILRIPLDMAWASARPLKCQQVDLKPANPLATMMIPLSDWQRFRAGILSKWDYTWPLEWYRKVLRTFNSSCGKLLHLPKWTQFVFT